MPIEGRFANVLNAADLEKQINDLEENRSIYLHCLTMTYGQINIYNNNTDQISTATLARLLRKGGFTNSNKLFKHEGTQFIPESATIRAICGTYAESETVLKAVYCETTADTISCSTGAQIVIHEDIIKM